MHYRAILVLLLLSARTCRAQQNTATETYEVRGTVVNSVSGEPIPGALVRLVGVGQSARHVRADADGKFAFANVAPGVGRLIASKPGYFAMERDSGRLMQVTVRVHQDSAAKLVKLIPEGVIYGRITGADGEPIDGMEVQLLERKVEEGKGRWVRGNVREVAITDDEGKFRLAELQAGTYFLLAGIEHLDDIANGADSSKVSQYGAMYYPGVSEFAAAAAIELSPGRHTEADVKLTRQRLYRISGRVVGSPPGSAVELLILNGTGQGIGMYRANSNTGAFDATSVPASASRLVAICQGGEGTYFGEMKLKLTGDLVGVRLTVFSAPQVIARVRTQTTHEGVAGSQDTASGTPAFPGQNTAAPVSITLVPEESDSLQGEYPAEPLGSSQMVIQSILPGDYRLRVEQREPSYVESARAGDADLLNDDFTVAPGAAPPPIEIALRDDGAQLTVSPQQAGVNAAGLVVLWPLDAQKMIESERAYVDAPGRFKNLRPGRYLVLALENGEQAEYRNTEFRQKYQSKWQEITLEANQSATMRVELTKEVD